MEIILRELAEMVNGEVIGDPSLPIHGIAGIKEAQPGEITFLANSRYFHLLPDTKASAVIIPHTLEHGPLAAIKTDNPYLAFAKILRAFHTLSYSPSGIHPTAVIDPTAQLGHDLSIHPLVNIGQGARIGNRVQIFSGVSIGDYCQIGDDCILYPNVVVYHQCLIGNRCIIHAGVVIGSDGFGYVFDGEEHFKIPQVGRVILEDKVEVGAGTTIDRGTLSDTVIKKGTKIDNLVQIAHNVIIGENSIIASQTGIAGSSEIGQRVTMGGQTGVAGHLKVGDYSVIAAKTGISKDVPPKSIMAGAIARPIQEWRKSEVYTRRLPELFDEIKHLRQQLEKIHQKLE